MMARKKANTKFPQTVEKVCEYCGKLFNVSHKKVRQGDGRFCSMSCRAHIAPLKSWKRRFFARIQKPPELNACWIWVGTFTHYGYGSLSVNGHIKLAHRLSYEIHVGPIPEGLFVCHRCPTGEDKRCVNPDHLYVGKAQDNVNDKVRENHQAHIPKKLTADDVQEIRLLYRTGSSQRRIAELFSVSHRTIGAIIHGKTWKHIP